MSIPKVIHYCWFGRGEKPKIVNKCIDSWKRSLNDYEIKEWNEDNFNIEINEFVKEAYLNKKYAFVSDYVRVYALYNFGGIYLDTDVEVLKDFNNYLNEESFWGFEAGNFIATSTIGAKKGNKIIKQFLGDYENKSFYKEDGTLNTTTNVQIVSNIFKKLGVRLDGTYQKLNRLGSIYPMEIFSPYDYRYYDNLSNKDTVTIHHYYKSWICKKDKVKQSIKKIIIRLFGVKFIKSIYER